MSKNWFQVRSLLLRKPTEGGTKNFFLFVLKAIMHTKGGKKKEQNHKTLRPQRVFLDRPRLSGVLNMVAQPRPQEVNTTFNDVKGCDEVKAESFL